MQLRSIQERAIDMLRAEVEAGRNRIVLTAPTGFGKTVVIAAIARGHLEHVPDAHVLVVVHRRELVRQTIDKLRRAGIEAGVVQADTDTSENTRVIVATLQTLVSRGTRPRATMVIWDECHHCPALSFRAVYADYKDALHIGATATPERADGKPLGDMFESMVIGATVRELTNTGLLVPSEVIGFGGMTQELAMPVVEAYQRFTPGRAAVVFAVSVAHARELANEFNVVGVRAASVDGETENEIRDDVLGRFASGDLDVVTNCFVLTEGVDIPRADVCILARGPEHVGAFLQMIGRVLRLYPGKRIATVLDLRGATYALGLPDEDRRWQIDGPPIRTEKIASLRRCKECFAIFRPVRKCPRCGAKNEVLERIPRTLRRAEKAEKLNALPQAERDRRAVWGIAMRLKRSPKYARATTERLLSVARFIFERRNGRKPEIREGSAA